MGRITSKNCCGVGSKRDHLIVNSRIQRKGSFTPWYRHDMRCGLLSKFFDHLFTGKIEVRIGSGMKDTHTSVPVLCARILSFIPNPIRTSIRSTSRHAAMRRKGFTRPPVRPRKPRPWREIAILSCPAARALYPRPQSVCTRRPSAPAACARPSPVRPPT